MNDKPDQREAISQLLNDAHIEYVKRQYEKDNKARIISQNMFAADVLKVNVMSFSQWINKNRLPTGRNIYDLAAGLERALDYDWARRLYDILDVPPPVPFGAEDLIAAWRPASAAARKKAVIIMRESVETEEENSGNNQEKADN